MKLANRILLLIIIFYITTFSFCFAAEYTDTKGHWAEKEIQKWSDYKIIQGSNGLFRPSDNITRGEMAVIIDRIMKFQNKATNSFNDLDNSFYTDAVLKVNKAGILKGENLKVRPKDYITREEAVVMLGRTFGMDEDTKSTTPFADNKSISSWAIGYVNCMKTAGYIAGNAKNNFRPKDKITRAEVVKILDNIIDGYCYESKAYTLYSNKFLVINNPNAILKNGTINGTIIITEGTANGTMTFDNVNITAKVHIKSNVTINIRNASKAEEINIESQGASINIEDNSTVKRFNIRANKTNINGERNCITSGINVFAEDSNIIVLNANISVDKNINNTILNGKKLSAGTIITSDNEIYNEPQNAEGFYNVIFNSTGGSYISPITNVKSGSKISIPKNPKRDGFEFSGWYSNNTSWTGKLTTNTLIKSNVTYYAKWIESQPKININVEDKIIELPDNFANYTYCFTKSQKSPSTGWITPTQKNIEMVDELNNETMYLHLKSITTESTFSYQYKNALPDADIDYDTGIIKLDRSAKYSISITIPGKETKIENINSKKFDFSNIAKSLDDNNATLKIIELGTKSLFSSNETTIVIESDELVLPDTYGSPAREAILELYDEKIMMPYPDNLFHPEESITKAEVVKILVNMIGKQDLENMLKGDTKFTDVKAGHWACGYINIAVGQNIIRDDGVSKFYPDSKATYKDVMVMVVRALGYANSTESTGTYPTNYIVKAVDLDITKGISDTITAESLITRQDVAVLVYNALELDD
jgi:uncharacterized repeat protein (TIGR02543 family)